MEGPKRKHTSPPSSFLAEQVDAWLSDHAECNVLAAWRKSLCLVETTVPRLRLLWPLVGAARIDAPDGTLHAQRLCTEEEVRAKVQQQAQREGAVLTTRQKLAMQAAQAAGTARPKKMMRNVLGQAIVQDYD